jgi:hypothetical protein
VVQEDERPDHPVPGGRQHTPDHETPEIPRPGVDDQRDARAAARLRRGLKSGQNARRLLERHGIPPGRGYDPIEEAFTMANELDLKSEMKKGVDLLKTLRDEVKVKLHLAGMDVKDQWAKLEPELSKVERAADQATEASKKLMDETLKRLKSIRDSLR